MIDHLNTYERQPSQPVDHLGLSSPTPVASPALSDGYSSAESHSVATPPASTDTDHSQEVNIKSSPALPPLRPEAWGEGSERPFRHLGLGLDTRLSSEKSITRHKEPAEEPEDRFGLASTVSKTDKVKGRLMTLLGRITHNNGKILEGQVRSNGAHLALRSEERSAME